MYSQKNQQPIQSFTCPDCGSTRFRIGGGKITCTNCNYKVSTNKSNKYGAQKTEFGGRIYDSKFEASEAHTLELRKLGKDIKDYDTQYKVEMWAYDQNGKPALKMTHKVDFRIHHNDGSYELWETKGQETADWKWRVKWLEAFWLPLHPDHTYTVIKQNKTRYRR